MKKITMLLILLLITNLNLAGCGHKEEIEDPGQDEELVELDEEESEKGITVDKNLLNVEITLPSSLVGDLNDFNEEEYLSENEGIKAAKVNEDGSLTLSMSKGKHEELMNEMEKEVELSFSELIESEDTPYIKEIKYTTGFREVKLIVDREEYENAFDLTPLLVGVTVGMYQVYGGMEYKTTVIIEDISTGDEINLVTYPDALEE
ncbi:hypothetical protein [Schnuerera ultunensis]|uniref:Antigen I/II N-terminal domain-containing protein n=1 Tax=[Clostridium] ultunense Esp TaxID=1288971 RepID=A0A1M4PQ25_9FIRM|nr:hypothetical protein [Schnuerera ultunensis]SHD77572.1 conserved protein of unknown function [[Clostridium] ultunense Esp]